jgi:hypothetical protein
MRPSPSADDLRWWLDTNSRSDGDCQIWKHPTRSGYPSSIIIDGKEYQAPRVALMLATGENDPRLLTYHSCKNRLCVKAAHLFWGPRSSTAATPKTRRRRKARTTWEMLETI